jgi:predicted transcriptional regulator
MSKAKELKPENTSSAGEDEDAATLAAIDEGIRGAKTGPITSIEQVRKLLTQWITASSSRKEL